MHIILDLDGTLVDTMSPKFDDIKYGRDRSFALSDIPSCPGADQFVADLKMRGHGVTIVSDSHEAYVRRIAIDKFDVPYLSLADKPNTKKLQVYLERVNDFPFGTPASEIVVIGDSVLDVQIARRLGLQSALVDGTGRRWSQDPMEIRKHLQLGATYTCRDYAHVIHCLDHPREERFVLEDPAGQEAARLLTQSDRQGRFRIVRSLARQQQGPSDAFDARARLARFERPDRTQSDLQSVAIDVGRFLRERVLSNNRLRWDAVTCVADKSTSSAPRKMVGLLDALDVGSVKTNLFVWKDNVDGRLRDRANRSERVSYLQQFVRLKDDVDVRGKGVIVIDDQYTTGATAQVHTDLLFEAGAENVLFLTLFHLTEEVPVEKDCPQCGKTVRVKYSRAGGPPFYSCVPPRYRGAGCGWTGNVGHDLH